MTLQVALFQLLILSSHSFAQYNLEEKMIKTAKEMEINIYGNFTQVYQGSGQPITDDSYKIIQSKTHDIPIPDSFLVTKPEKPSLSLSQNIGIYWGYASTFFNAITSQVSDSGIFGGGAPAFEEISKNILRKVSATFYKPRKNGDKSLFLENGFIEEFENITNSKFSSGNSIKFLIDGPESFRYKDYLMKNAKKSIYIATWAFYDDITGIETLKILFEKKRDGLDIKVITDGKVVSSHGISIIGKLEKAGIEVIRYKEKRRSADIWHVKMLIVDDKYAIVGGMNFGDPYSHKNSAGPKWRDTDVLYMGPAVDESIKYFAEIWNKEVIANRLNYGIISYSGSNSSEGSDKISITYSNPPDKNGTPILTSIIKAIYGATKTINIENAYFVPIPALTEALLAARERGVEVNIFTNSKDSIDAEARVLIDVSMKALLPLFKAGANIYLKKGDTLHSKFMTVDGIFCSIGSYNLHPRGERYDTEMNINIISSESVAYLDKVFKDDITNLAVKINSERELVPEQGWFSRIIEKYFYAQLNRPL